MTDSIICPKCGTSMRKGSTFCLKCGTPLAGDSKSFVDTSEAEDMSEIGSEDTFEKDEGDVVLPELDDWGTQEDETDTLNEETMVSLSEAASMMSESPLEEEVEVAPSDELSWDEESLLSRTPKTESDDEKLTETSPDTKEKIPVSPNSSWETPNEYSPEIKVGMPFQEVAPPKVVDSDMVALPEKDVMAHLFPDEQDAPTREAVSHLFPHGRGETTKDFVDIVVGKPKRIGADISPSYLETPTCTECGHTTGSDSFEYPPAVYEVMGKARLNHGLDLMKDNEHEKAIEQFEIAKKLFEHADLSKWVDEATKRVDEGYDAMAEHHYIQGENHLKEKQFEWAVVQFKKARELYMFSTDAKKRAKCSERARDAYEEWGRILESEGDQQAKEGNTREALATYTEAAEKYREADAPKRIQGLEKKIRKA
ncbi:MAG: zinc-ribbon domain-containing protein [Candidatus Thorarchaeota archaeon]